MFDEFRSLWIRYNRMSPTAMDTHVTAAAMICAVRKNLLYSNYVQTQHVLDDMSVDEYNYAYTIKTLGSYGTT